MLPFPNRIISSKQLLIPVTYVGVTCCLCYYFLMAFVDTQSMLISSNSKLQINNNNNNNNNNNRAVIEGVGAHHSVVERSTGNTPPEPSDFTIQVVPPRQDHELSQDEGGEEGKNNKDGVEPLSDFDTIDKLSPVYYPWIDDAQCRMFPVSFAKKKTFKPRALVSYPGSGNSWVRYLLEGSTGIFTGSIFNDKKLYSSGLLGELRSPYDGSTIVQKTHHDTISALSKNSRTLRAHVKLTELMFGYRGILLIRNPYNALRSYWNFMNTRDHKAHALVQQFSLEKWQNFVEDGAKRWAQLIQVWLENSLDYIIVQYEELQTEPRREILRMMEYLSQPVDEKRIACVLSHLEGPFHRIKSSETSPETEEQTQLLSFTSHNSHLDLAVQENIEHVNRLFALYDINMRLNYTCN